jgi:hypothetical protein
MSPGCNAPSSITITSSAMCDGMHPESQVRSGLAAGERWIRTLGPPSGQHFFQRPSQNPATTNQPNSRNRILTIDKASFVDQRPRLDLVAARGGTHPRRDHEPFEQRDGVAAPITTGYIVGLRGPSPVRSSCRHRAGHRHRRLRLHLHPRPAGGDRGSTGHGDVSTPIRSRAAKTAAPVTLDTIVARREERACRQEPR